MKKILFLFVFCCIFLAINAQEYEGIARGDKEVTFNGMVISASGYTIGNIFLSYGQYVSKKLLIGLAPGVSISEDATDVSGQLFVNYNFSATKRTFPYLKASYYQQSFDIPSGSDFFSLGFIQLGGGLKTFFNSRVSWDTSVAYGIPAKSESGSEGILMILTGIAIKW